MVKYFVKTNATNEKISAAHRVIAAFKQPERMIPTAYGKTLWTKTYRCGIVCQEKRIKTLFVKGLHEHIQPAFQTYWSEDPTEDFHQLATFASDPATFGSEKTGTTGGSSSNPGGNK